jgi:hypothetical protein
MSSGLLSGGFSITVMYAGLILYARVQPALLICPPKIIWWGGEAVKFEASQYAVLSVLWELKENGTWHMRNMWWKRVKPTFPCGCLMCRFGPVWWPSSHIVSSQSTFVNVTLMLNIYSIRVFLINYSECIQMHRRPLLSSCLVKTFETCSCS